MSNRQIAKNAVFLYIRMAVVMIVSIYMSRIILAQLGETDYGVYNVVGGVVTMVLSLNSALAFGTQRFISYYMGEGNSEMLSKVFSSSVIVHIALAFLVAIILETGGHWFVNSVLNIPEDRVFAANIVLHISVITSFIAIFQVPFSALIISHERMNIYAYVSLVDVVLKLLIAYSLQVLPYDKMISYASLLTIVQLVQACIYITYCKLKFSESKIILHKDMYLYKDILSYGGWNLLGSGGFMLSDQGVNMMLNVFFGPSINAARAIALQVKNAVSQFISNLQTAFNPQLVKLYAEGNKEAMLALLMNNIKLSLLLMWIILLPLYIELDFLLDIWLVEVPDFTLIFARITLLKLFLVCFEQPFITANGATGFNKVFTTVSALFLISTLPLSYCALQLCNNPSIVFLVDIIVYLIMVVWKVFYLKKQIGLSISTLLSTCIKPIGLVALLSTPVVLIIHRFIESSTAEFFIVCIVSLFINVVLAWHFVLPDNIKQFILGTVRKT